MSPFRLPHRLVAASLCAPALIFAQPAAASTQSDWGTVSDIGVGALAAWSLGAPLARHDAPGAWQAAGSIGASVVISQGLKRIFPETRPDGSDRRSFPSGHTSVAFAAATSIYRREGPAQGLPAFALASLVGVGRIEADKHYWYDVGAGAAIGIASGLLITHRRHKHSVAFITGNTHTIELTYAARF